MSSNVFPKILIIDDNETVTTFLEEILILKGYIVSTASSGEAGLSKLKEFSPDLIFLDISMPGMSGIEVLKELAPLRDKSYSVIIISGHDDKEIKKQCFEMGTYFFLDKPFEINNILTLVKQVISTKKHKIQLEIMFNNLIDGVLLVDTSLDKIVRVNKSFLKMFCMTRDQILGKPFDMILAKENIETYMNRTGIQLEIGKEIPYIKDDGSILLAENNIATIEIEDCQYLLISIHDITAKKLAEKELREKKTMMLFQARQAQMGEILTMILHQWKQPLMTISAAVGIIELLKRMDNLKSDKFGSSLKNITDNIRFMSETIEDFRDFFKKEKEKSSYNLKKITENTLFFLSDAIKENSIEVSIDNRIQNEIRIIGNEIRQVLLNIFTNAVDALVELKPPKPVINIDLFEDDNFQIIQIANNGGQIPEEIISKVFNSYFTTKGDVKGTGIGLYMSRIIIENNHNGKIEVENIENGVKFSIFLPK